MIVPLSGTEGDRVDQIFGEMTEETMFRRIATRTTVRVRDVKLGAGAEASLLSLAIVDAVYVDVRYCCTRHYMQRRMGTLW